MPPFLEHTVIHAVRQLAFNHYVLSWKIYGEAKSCSKSVEANQIMHVVQMSRSLLLAEAAVSFAISLHDDDSPCCVLQHVLQSFASKLRNDTNAEPTK